MEHAQLSAARRLVGHPVAAIVEGLAMLGKAVRIEFDGDEARLGVMFPGQGIYTFAPEELRRVIDVPPLP